MRIDVYKCDWCGNEVDDLYTDNWITIESSTGVYMRISNGRDKNKQGKCFLHVRPVFHFCCPECLLNFITSEPELV